MKHKNVTLLFKSIHKYIWSEFELDLMFKLSLETDPFVFTQRIPTVMFGSPVHSEKRRGFRCTSVPPTSHCPDQEPQYLKLN